jgi:cytidylate kinase
VPESPPAARTRGHPARRLIVAIDGPSGSGKSTVARGVAKRLGLRYLDTGAMYRAVTHRALEERIDLEDDDALGELAERTVLSVGTDPRRFRIAADGTDVTRSIRSRAVSNAVSAVSAAPGVRARLVRTQRELIGAGGIVVEGRDIGTVVAPDAPVKIFLTASSEARATRRHAESGEGVSRAVTQAEIDRRDQLDSTRAAAPLVRADDAVELDSTALTPDEVVDAVVARCQ